MKNNIMDASPTDTKARPPRLKPRPDGEKSEIHRNSTGNRRSARRASLLSLMLTLCFSAKVFANSPIFTDGFPYPDTDSMDPDIQQQQYQQQQQLKQQEQQAHDAWTQEQSKAAQQAQATNITFQDGVSNGTIGKDALKVTDNLFNWGQKISSAAQGAGAVGIDPFVKTAYALPTLLGVIVQALQGLDPGLDQIGGSASVPFWDVHWSDGAVNAMKTPGGVAVWSDNSANHRAADILKGAADAGQLWNLLHLDPNWRFHDNGDGTITVSYWTDGKSHGIYAITGGYFYDVATIVLSNHGPMQNAAVSLAANGDVQQAAPPAPLIRPGPDGSYSSNFLYNNNASVAPLIRPLPNGGYAGNLPSWAGLTLPGSDGSYSSNFSDGYGLINVPLGGGGAPGTPGRDPLQHPPYVDRNGVQFVWDWEANGYQMVTNSLSVLTTYKMDMDLSNEPTAAVISQLSQQVNQPILMQRRFTVVDPANGIPFVLDVSTGTLSVPGTALKWNWSQTQNPSASSAPNNVRSNGYINGNAQPGNLFYSGVTSNMINKYGQTFWLDHVITCNKLVLLQASQIKSVKVVTKDASGNWQDVPGGSVTVASAQDQIVIPFNTIKAKVLGFAITEFFGGVPASGFTPTKMYAFLDLTLNNVNFSPAAQSWTSVGGGGNPQVLGDNDGGTTWTSNGNDSSAVADFGQLIQFNKVILSQLQNAQNVKEVRMQISNDGTTWETIPGSIRIFSQAPQANLSLNFATVTARYVRLYVNQASGSFQLGELQIFKDANAISPADPSIIDYAATSLRTMTSSSKSLDNSGSIATDALFYGGSYWCADPNSRFSDQWFIVDLGRQKSVGSLVIRTPYDPLPNGIYHIEVSDNYLNWTRPDSVVGFCGNQGAIVAFRQSQSCRFVKVVFDQPNLVPAIKNIAIYSGLLDVTKIVTQSQYADIQRTTLLNLAKAGRLGPLSSAVDANGNGWQVARIEGSLAMVIRTCSGGSFRDWQLIGSLSVATDPCITMNVNPNTNRYSINIFWIDLQKNIRQLTGGSPSNLSEIVYTDGKAVAVNCTSDATNGNVYVIVQAPDNLLWYRSFSNRGAIVPAYSPATPWQYLGADCAFRPAITANNGWVNVYFTHASGGLMALWFDRARWNGPVSFGWTTKGDVSAQKLWNDNEIVSVRGANNETWVRTWTNAAGWANWQVLTTNCNESPSVSAMGNGTVFWRDSAGVPYHQSGLFAQ